MLNHLVPLIVMHFATNISLVYLHSLIIILMRDINVWASILDTDASYTNCGEMFEHTISTTDCFAGTYQSDVIFI